jgi:hypothetical protein
MRVRAKCLFLCNKLSFPFIGKVYVFAPKSIGKVHFGLIDSGKMG